MGSLIKYVHEIEGEGSSRLSYSRADLDGAPFRSRNGVLPGLVREEEYEDLAEKVYDAKVEIFNLLDEEERLKYQDIIDRVQNGLYRLILRKHGIVATEEKYLVLIEYAAQYMELPPTGYRADSTTLSPVRREG